MQQPAHNTEKLDEYLADIVRALHGAVKQGLAHAQEPREVDRAIHDSKEIIDLIMAGNVKEWLQ